MTTNDAEMKQNKFNLKVDALNNYFPKVQKYIEAKNSLINNVKNFYEGEEKQKNLMQMHSMNGLLKKKQV